ncbi:MAG: rhodanese-like domain-containing protein [Rubrivivax sp.]|nr:rhodanese-like domain-containing protein [Rubrivivax sp.]
MPSLYRPIVKMALTLTLVFTPPAFAVDLPGPLVETAWLSANLNSKDLVVVDVRLKDDITTLGFVPGARWWDWSEVRVDRSVDGVELESVVPTKAQFEALMAALNITPSSTVVIVPLSHTPSSFTMGTRAYWTLKYFGHDKVALLNGGMAKWTAEKKTSNFVPQTVAQHSVYRVKTVHQELLAKTADVMAAVDKRNVQIVDARTPEFYLGQKKKDYVYAKGHISGAKIFANTEVQDKQTRAFKSTAALKAQLAQNGIDVDQPMITYCDSGHLSTGLWFIAHEMMGNKNVRLYDGSMHEWTKDPKRPVVTGQE